MERFDRLVRMASVMRYMSGGSPGIARGIVREARHPADSNSGHPIVT
jgi:hypothetical protein